MLSSQEVEEKSKDQLYKMRHSLAHILAQAVLKLRPGSKLGFGPVIDTGFYYDFVIEGEPVTESDFKELEKLMAGIIKEGQDFVIESKNFNGAMDQIDEMGEPYKKEYAKELFQKKSLDELTFYKNGPFIDMCEGPHIQNTKEIPKACFKLRNVAGAYWRGDSKNQMMTRIYAWAFESRDELRKQVKAYEEAQRWDHKKVGKELELFHIDETVGKGLPLWMPNGTVIREEIEKLLKEMEFRAGYQRVATPHITKADLYYQTGHLPYYSEGMYPFMELKESSEDGGSDVKEQYCLRPMNCPHHHKIFGAQMRSYRELPLRLAEYGQVYRFEDSGSLAGLARVRGMCMNDAHIYCTEEQIKEEFLNVMHMHDELYKLLGLDNYHMRLSTWDPEDPKGKEKFLDNPEAWEKTQNILREAMKESGLPFVEGKGEAAFYGPKIDFQYKLVTGREETISTNQLDFGVAERLDLEYIGKDGKAHRPYIIHRAPAGTHERFIAFLIEHFKGAFPLWLSPVQVKVISISEKFNGYASKVVDELRRNYVRIEMDHSENSLNKKIRLNTKKKIPVLVIIGEKEEQENSVTLRMYGVEEQSYMKLGEFQDWILKKTKNRDLNLKD